MNAPAPTELSDALRRIRAVVNGNDLGCEFDDVDPVADLKTLLAEYDRISRSEVRSEDALRIARAYLVEEAGSGSVGSSLGNAKAIAAIDAALSGTSAQASPGWIDQNHQIDRYGVALMMIREGCVDPAGLARRILSEFEASPVPSAQENTP